MWAQTTLVLLCLGGECRGWSDWSSDAAKPGLQDRTERGTARGPGPGFSGAEHLQSGPQQLQGMAAGMAGLILSAFGKSSSPKTHHHHNNNNIDNDKQQLQGREEFFKLPLYPVIHIL